MYLHVWLIVVVTVAVQPQPGDLITLDSSSILHLGCFTTKSTFFNDYLIHDPLSWSECLEFCAHRLTIYMAVQQEPGQTTYNYCYCFGNLSEVLTAVTNESCSTCLDNMAHYCGGTDTLTVYRIREKTPLSVVVATSFGVLIIVDGNKTSLGEFHPQANNIEIDYWNDSITFIHNHRLYRSYYSSSSEGYIQPNQIRSQHAPMCYRIALDWLRHDIYCYRDGYIYIYKPKQDYYQHIMSVSKVNGLAVDPFGRLLFVLTSEKLLAYSLPSYSVIKTYSNKIERFLERKKIILDIKKRIIYLLVKESENVHTIVSVNYNDTVLRSIYSSKELSRAMAFDIFEDQLVWANLRDPGDDVYILYSCKLTPRCLAEDVMEFTSLSLEINDLKIYNPDMQQPDLCDRVGCSHVCNSISLQNVVCSCPDDMVLGRDNKTCEVSGGKEIAKIDPKHIGCFSTTIDYKSQYRVNQSLKWDECVNVCNNRLNKFLGIEVEESQTVFVQCFCSNLIEGYLIDNSSSCAPCVSDNTTFCGGNGSVSLYQLRVEVPLALLLATESGVKQFTGDFVAPKLLVNSSKPVEQVYYDYWEDEIIFISGDNTYRSYYRPQVNRYVRPKVVSFLDGRPVDMLAIDWVNHDLFLVKGRSPYYSNGILEKFNVDTQNSSTLLYNFEPECMAIDTLRRLLFFITNGKLTRLNLITEEKMSYNNFKHTTLKPFLSIDIRSETIYTIASEEDDDLYIMSIGYNSLRRRVLFGGPELTDPFGFVELNGDIVWGNIKYNWSSIYRCKLTPTCQPEKLELIYQTKEMLYDLQIYSPDVQNVTLGRLCLDRGCSHNCSVGTKLEAVCHCPSNMTLTADDKTCVEITPSTINLSPTTKSSIYEIISTSLGHLDRASERQFKTVLKKARQSKAMTTENTISSTTMNSRGRGEPVKLEGNAISVIEVIVVTGVIAITYTTYEHANK